MERDPRQAKRIDARLHLLIGIIAIVGLPLASTLLRAGGLAFTMFSGSGSYRLRIVTLDESGGERRIPPTAVAAQARGSIGDVLAGSEDWRFAPFGSLIRRRLDQVARLACATTSRTRQVTAALDERSTLDAPVRTTTAELSCR